MTEIASGSGSESATGEPEILRICTLCAEVYPGELCPKHEDEPLLDPADDEVQHMLVQLDDKRRRLVGGSLAFGGGVGGLALGILITSVLGALPVSPLVVVALVAAAGGVGGGMLGRRVFKPRFIRWTGEPEDSLATEATAGPPWWVLGLGAVGGAGLGFWVGPIVQALFPSLSVKLMLGIMAVVGGVVGVGLARFGYSTVHTLRHLKPADAPGSGPEGARLCMMCGRLYDTESCPVHEFEPLLDPADQNVRYQLAAEEDRQKRSLAGMFAIVIGVSLVVVVGAISLAVGLSLLQIAVACIVVAASGSALGNLAARKLYRPRFTAWTTDAEQPSGVESPGDVNVKAELADGIQSAARAFLGGSGPSWRLTLGGLVGGAGVGAGLGALLAQMSVLSFLGTSGSALLFGIIGLVYGFELTSAIHAERKQIRRFVIVLAVSGGLGAMAGIVLGAVTPWAKLGIPLLALTGLVLAVALATEGFRVLRKVRKTVGVLTD